MEAKKYSKVQNSILLFHFLIRIDNADPRSCADTTNLLMLVYRTHICGDDSTEYISQETSFDGQDYPRV